MRQILVISPDDSLLKELSWSLEQAGYGVALSGSLEESFLEVNQCETFLVIVDSRALRDKPEQTQRFLRWFRHRSPVLYLCDDCTTHEWEPGHCLPRTIDQNELLAWIENLQR